MTNLKIGFGGIGVAIVLSMAGCALDASDPPKTEPKTESSETSAPEIGQPPAIPNESRFDADFVAASAEYDVPAAVLKAIAWTETRYEMVVGEEEMPGRPASFGVMALGGARLEEGARLAKLSTDDVKKDARANVRAAAALLSSWAAEAKIDRSKVAAWESIVARYSTIDDETARRAYVRDGVYRAMKKGLGSINADGSYFDLFGNEADEAATPLAAGPDYAGSIWRASPNYNSRGGVKPAMVVIHTCEGNYAGCWGWLANSAAGASAHYVVSSDGKEISQLVSEANRAWHVAASYNCNLNGGVDCARQGQSVNTFAIGIEHAGFASQSSFPAGQIEASAALVCDMTKAHGIPRDRFHIVGHGKLQPYDRTDPGPNWPWTSYIARINTLCGSGGTTPTPTPTPAPVPADGLVIDSNNANNDQAIASIEVSGNWTASTNVGGYHGTGYWWADAAPLSDGATFWFHLSSAATKTIDAHWTASADRSSAAPFIAFDAQGNRLGTVAVDQTTNGGQWNTLGSFAFTAGWNKIVLSRWTGTGKIVVADAVRVR
jgi:hypothetical protein